MVVGIELRHWERSDIWTRYRHSILESSYKGGIVVVIADAYTL